MPESKNYDAEALRQADLDHCIHPWQDLGNWPQAGATIIVRGEGAHVWDAKGRKFIDGIGGLWFANVGFGRQELIEAAARQMAELPQYSYFTDLGNPPAAQLAAKLAELAPGDLNHVFYSTGGSSANDTAGRTAHYYFNNLDKPSKRLFISRRDAYHGSTYFSAALSGKMGDKRGFHSPDGLVHYLSAPNCYRMPPGINGEAAYCDYLADEFEAKVAELGADNIAAFFAEPIMGAGGVLVSPAGYHQRMKQVCEANDILYISDEVVTGFGRLGHFFASEAVFGVAPDMITVAKGITSGYMPLGATLISERIFQGLSKPRPGGGEFAHGFTYSGHAVACAVALANIELMQRENLCERVRKTGPHFLKRLKTLGDLPIVGDVRGSHFMLCVELVQDRQSKEPFPEAVAIEKRLDRETQARGMIVRLIGNMCVLSPALILSEREIDEMVAILKEAIEAVMAGLKREGIPFGN